MSIVRVDVENLALLDRVDPDCFDEPIDRERARRCVQSPDAELYIDDLAVASAHRRRGVARRLVDACRRCGREAGAETVWVATESDNEPAVALYRSLGLQPRAAVVFE